VTALSRLPELREALLLREWRDQDADDQIAAIDQAARLEVARRFGQVLFDILQRGDAVGRQAAVSLLGEVAPTLREIRLPGWSLRGFSPVLADLVRDPQSTGIREAAAHALCQISADPAVAVPALSRLFESGEPALRRAAARGLVDFVEWTCQSSRRPNGPLPEAFRTEVLQVSRAILPVVGRGLTDADSEVRRLSLETIRQATLAVGKLIADPRGSLTDDPEEVEEHRHAVARERADLEALARELKDLAPPLSAVLRDSEPGVRLRAHQALEEVEAAWQWLQEQPAVGPEQGQARLTARRLGALPGGQEASLIPPQGIHAVPLTPPLLDAQGASVPGLAAGLADPEVKVRRAALAALETLGEEAAPAVPALIRALADADAMVRWGAARTLRKIGPVHGGAAVPVLTALLRDADLDVRLTSAEALGSYGPAAQESVPALVQALGAGDYEMRLAAIHALEGIGLPAQPAIPALAAALKAPQVRVRQAAAALLSKFGPAALDAKEALRQALLDPDDQVRKIAGDALLDLLPPPEDPPAVAGRPEPETASMPVLLKPVPAWPSPGAGQRVIAAAPGFAPVAPRPARTPLAPTAPAGSAPVASFHATDAFPPIFLLPPTPLAPLVQVARAP
jgi:HEAT repeat protein